MKQPANLMECYEFLDVVVDEDYRKELMKTEVTGLQQSMRDLRQYILNNWLYRDDLPLMGELRKSGLEGATREGLCLALIVSYQKHLKNKDLD